eukprot:COSAG02_NODE_50196_length_322_cov_0.668161_1_plen_20_part_10
MSSVVARRGGSVVARERALD